MFTSELSIERFGNAVLAIGFGAGTVLILALATINPLYAISVPAAAALLLVAGLLVKHPHANAVLLITGLFVTSGYSDGIVLLEVVHGSYVVAFLAVWFLNKILTGSRVTYDASERVFLLFLLVLPLTVFLTVLFDGSIREYVSEMFALMHFAVYFPIRDIVRGSERGARVVFLSFLALALLIVFRNGMEYQAKIAEAAMSWQVERARVIENDGLIMSATVAFLTATALVRKPSLRLCCAVGSAIVGIGLIVTQSRAFWVTLLVALVLVFVLIRPSERRGLVKLGAGAALVFALLMILILRSDQLLIISGLLTRLTSLGTALTNDLSLLNRFLESKAALARIANNPIVGYGAGVGYTFFDATRYATDLDSFVHNGYLGLWYKWGIWGLAAVVYFWLRTLMHGIAATRVRQASTIRRVSLVAALAAVAAYLIPANTSNPFVLNDSIFLFALLWAMIRGNALALRGETPRLSNG